MNGNYGGRGSQFQAETVSYNSKTKQQQAGQQQPRPDSNGLPSQGAQLQFRPHPPASAPKSSVSSSSVAMSQLTSQLSQVNLLDNCYGHTANKNSRRREEIQYENMILPSSEYNQQQQQQQMQMRMIADEQAAHLNGLVRRQAQAQAQHQFNANNTSSSNPNSKHHHIATYASSSQQHQLYQQMQFANSNGNCQSSGTHQNSYLMRHHHQQQQLLASNNNNNDNYDTYDHDYDSSSLNQNQNQYHNQNQPQQQVTHRRAMYPTSQQQTKEANSKEDQNSSSSCSSSSSFKPKPHQQPNNHQQAYNSRIPQNNSNHHSDQDHDQYHHQYHDSQQHGSQSSNNVNDNQTRQININNNHNNNISQQKSSMHVNFNRSSRPGAGNPDAHDDDSESPGRKKKYLTAKYGQQQMNLIKKRLKVEMWLYEQLQDLAKGTKAENELDEIDIDLDQLLDMEDDGARRRWLKKTLDPFADLPIDRVDKFISDVIEQAKLL